MKAVTFSTLYWFFLLNASAQHASSKIYQNLHACKIAGITDSVLCGTYPVRENREAATGRMINLNIVVIPALHPNAASTPVFYLEGGPGVAATNSASFFADTSVPYRKYHDIVLIDIRGTGKSNGLDCPSLQVKQDLNQQFEEMYAKAAVHACFDFLSKKADLKQYTTTNIVKDIESVRKWLGYGKINIYGLSYGTRVALVYMKMFPAAIESCILWSPIPTYGKMPLYHAKFAQNSLQHLFDDCHNDSACHYSFPAFGTEFNSLYKKHKDTLFSFKSLNSAGDSARINFSWNAFFTKIRSLMYTPGGMRQIPYIVHQASIGNLIPFINLYPRGRDTSNFIAEGLYLCITCSEDVPYINTKKIDALTRKTFMGTYRIDRQKQACLQWARGKLPADYFSPVKTDIPVLIFSGGFDPVTPTQQAKEIASHLSRSTLVIVPQMSHLFDGLSHPECFDELCIRFINQPMHPALPLDCIREMKPDPYKLHE
jgi:pimeloyl-ACP methyl ester carboxylesterase